MRPTCTFCGLEVDVNKAGIFMRITGWVEKRAQGGANSVHLPSDPMEFSHAHCMDEHKMAVSKGWVGIADTLFD